MVKGRRALTPEQQAKLKYVAEADDAWRRAKKYEREKYLRMAEERIAQFAYVRDQAVFDAVEAGVPKTVVGRDGLGTSNPYAVNEAYDRVHEVAAEVGVELPKHPVPRFAWGEVMAKDDRFVYGWITDTQNPDVETGNGMNDAVVADGFFVVVDRQNGVTTTLYTPGKVLTAADSGWEDMREWAAAHANEA